MTPDDLAAIESALKITLPKVYRDSMVPFRVPALAGNSDTDLWDNREAIIERNLEMRAGRFANPPWPPRLYFFGCVTGAQRSYAIELTTNDSSLGRGPYREGRDGLRILEIDNFNPEEARVVATSFQQWLDEWQSRAEASLRADGISPMGAPKKRALDKRAIGVGALFLLVLLLFWGKVVLKAHRESWRFIDWGGEASSLDARHRGFPPGSSEEKIEKFRKEYVRHPNLDGGLPQQR